MLLDSYSLTTQYTTLLKYFENGDYEDAEKLLNELKSNPKVSTIKTELFKIQDQIHSKSNAAKRKISLTEEIKPKKKTE